MYIILTKFLREILLFVYKKGKRAKTEYRAVVIDHLNIFVTEESYWFIYQYNLQSIYNCHPNKTYKHVHFPWNELIDAGDEKENPETNLA